MTDVDAGQTRPTIPFEEDEEGHHKNRNIPDIAALLDDAKIAWAEIEGDLEAALANNETKDRQARIYWFVYNAVVINPAGFEVLNFDAKRQKPKVSLKRGTTNAPYQLAAKYAHQEMRKMKDLDAKGARTNYNRWAKSFRVAGDDGLDSLQKFRELLDESSMSELEDRYTAFGVG